MVWRPSVCLSRWLTHLDTPGGSMRCRGLTYLLSTHADRQSVDISFTACLFVFVCTVTDFSVEDKASGVKFAGWFRGVLGRKSPILGNFAPQKPKIGRIGVWRVDVGSACVDNHQSLSLAVFANPEKCRSCVSRPHKKFPLGTPHIVGMHSSPTVDAHA